MDGKYILYWANQQIKACRKVIWLTHRGGVRSVIARFDWLYLQ